MPRCISRRFQPINYKTVSTIKGDVIESDVSVVYGLMFFDKSYIVESGLNPLEYSVEIYTSAEEADKIEPEYLIEVNGKYLKVKDVQYFRRYKGTGYGNAVILVSR